jgi:protein required for attachment to host cells
MHRKTKWVLVADGERAKFLTQEASVLVPVHATHHAEEDVSVPKDNDMDKPGRVGKNGMGLHSYPAHKDWHRFEKDLFAAEIAKIINKDVEAFDSLVIIAPPLILGDLRKHISTQVKNKVVHEVNKDLTKLPLDELLEYVTPPYK